MKKLAFLTLLAIGLVVSGCGNSTNPNTSTTTASGNWEAQLTSGRGSASQLNFVTSFSVTDTTGVPNEPLNITGFSFINVSIGSCFTNGVDNSTESGTATLNASSTGQVTGTMAFTVTSLNPPGNLLTLNGTTVTGNSSGITGQNGTLSNGVVQGNWTLSGSSGCSGTGSFLMCQGAPTCTPPS